MGDVGESGKNEKRGEKEREGGKEEMEEEGKG